MWESIKNFFAKLWGKSEALPQAPVKPEIPQPTGTPAPVLPWMKIAEGEKGIDEIPGTSHEKRILEYHSTTTLKASSDEVAWCSSFVNWVFYKLGWKRTNNALAASWLKWGVALTYPRYGCVVIFSRDGGNHVAFWLREEGDFVVCLGGNQDNSVSEKRYPKARVLGYRWPVEAVIGEPSKEPMLLKLPWDGKHADSAKWTVHLLKEIEASRLPDVPHLLDSPIFCPSYGSFSRNGRTIFWANLIAIMAKYESNYNPSTIFREPAPLNVDSVGLLQLSYEDVANYKIPFNLSREAKSLESPYMNLSFGILIMQKLVEQDSRVAGRIDGKFKGLARYWAVMREFKGSDPRPAYKAIVAHMRSIQY